MDDQEALDFYRDPANLEPAGPSFERKGPRLSSTVPVRFPQEMIAAVRRLATQDGITVSTWIRRLVASEIERREPPTTTTATDTVGLIVHHNFAAATASSTSPALLVPC
jgi:predicted DNA binding CopG/RHH family protein